MLGIAQTTVHNLEAIPLIALFLAMFVLILIGAEKATRREDKEFNEAIKEMTPIEVIDYDFIEPQRFEDPHHPGTRRNRNHGRPRGRKDTITV